MIPEIGLMVGAYIIVRMLQLCFAKNEHWFVIGCGVATILITVVVIVDLMSRGSSFPGVP